MRNHSSSNLSLLERVELLEKNVGVKRDLKESSYLDDLFRKYKNDRNWKKNIKIDPFCDSLTKREIKILIDDLKGEDYFDEWGEEDLNSFTKSLKQRGGRILRSISVPNGIMIYYRNPGDLVSNVKTKVFPV